MSDRVLPVLVVAVVAVAVALMVWYLRSTRVRTVPSGLVSGTADEVRRDLVVAVAGSPQTTVRPVDDRTLWVEHRQIPAWAVLVSVLALPFSLIALLVRSTVSGVLVVETVTDTECYVRISGVFHPAALRSLHRYMDARGVARVGSAAAGDATAGDAAAGPDR